MNHIYLHKFSATCGISAVNADGSLTDIAQTWASGLIGVTGEMMANGVRACIASGNEWPPSLPEFRAVCLPEKVPHYHRSYVALPRPPRDPELIEKSLASMRAALKVTA